MAGSSKNKKKKPLPTTNSKEDIASNSMKDKFQKCLNLIDKYGTPGTIIGNILYWIVVICAGVWALLNKLPWLIIFLITSFCAVMLYHLYVLYKVSHSKSAPLHSMKNTLRWTSIIMCLIMFLGIVYISYLRMNDRQYPILSDDDKIKLYNRPIATIQELHNNTITGRTVFLTDILHATPEAEQIGRPNDIRFKTFVDCDIFGPAIVFPERVQLVDCKFDYHIKHINELSNAVFYPVQNNQPIAGAIGMIDCKFRNCTISTTTFIGDKAHVHMWSHSSPSNMELSINLD